MTIFKPDHRKFNAMFFLGFILCGATYFTITSNFMATRIYWTLFQNCAGILFIGIALLNRYIIHIDRNSLIIKNRLGVFTKTIQLSEIKRIKITDKEYPVTLNSNTILHFFLWNKKFNRFKQIELFDIVNKKLFIIDGQAVDNTDFGKLCKFLKR
jgi:hypothetical protein